MTCKLREMTSYQRLKWELDQIHGDLIQEKTKTQIYKQALWKIANMKTSEITKAHDIAIQALYKTNETE